MTNNKTGESFCKALKHFFFIFHSKLVINFLYLYKIIFISTKLFLKYYRWASMKTVITWFFSVFFMMTGITARAEVAYTDHIRAELVSWSSLAMPGETVFLALQQNLAPKWHIYWRNPGSSGEPVSLTWKLPENVTTGPILWPLPQAIPTGPL